MKSFLSVLLSAGFFLAVTSISVAQDLYDEGSEPEKISEGFEFTEGPYWHNDGYLLFSDIPANRIYKWEPGGDAEVFVDPSGNSNGITGHPDGGMIIAQHEGKVSSLNEEGETSAIVDSYEGSRLNSPNDVAVTEDGTIYFTDPPFGVDEEARELEFSGVYRIDENNEAELLFDEFETPNGIIFSPDESSFYVNDTQTGQIMKFALGTNGDVSGAEAFAEVGKSSEEGAADGMAVDESGNLYTTAPGGVKVFSPEGEEIAHIETPERVTNLDWGQEEKRTLFLTSPSAVYSLQMYVTGHK